MGQPPPQQPGWGQDPGQPPYGQQPPYGYDPHAEPTHISPQQQPGQSPYGQQPPYGQQQHPQYGQPPPQYGQQPQYGQPQPQYGQQPYAQPPPYGGYPQQPPPGSGGGGKTLGIILAAIGALVVLGGGGAVVAYLAGAFDGAGSRSPEETVEQFWEAAQQGDCNQAIDLVTENVWNESGDVTREEGVADCEESFDPDEQIPSLESTRLVSERGDSAVVEATFDDDGETTTVPHDLVRVDGEWRVEDIDFSSS